MKVKIFVSSNSGIDYIDHSTNITSIPEVLYFCREETYKDYIEMTADMFYNRLRLDSSVEAKVMLPKEVVIAKLLNDAANDDYDNFLFLTSSRDFGDIEVAILYALEAMPEINYKIYNTATACYPLSYLALEADSLFEKGKTMDEVINSLDKHKNQILYFFSPANHDITYSTKYSERSILNSLGTLYCLNKSGLNKVNIGNSKPLRYLLDIAVKRISSVKNYIPYILYTNEKSRLNSVFESELIAEFGKIRSIPKYAITPAVGTKLGPYAMGFGVIELEDNE